MDEIARSCNAPTGDGTPCRRVLGPGQVRCHFHGGASPIARQAVAERLAAAALPAAAVLFEIIDAWRRETCPVCHMPQGDAGPVIRAAQIVLDRTGFHPTLAIQQAPVSDPAPWVRWLTRAETETMELFISNARQRMEAGEALPDMSIPLLGAGIDEGVVIFDEDDDPIQDAEVLITTGISTPEKVNDCG